MDENTIKKTNTPAYDAARAAAVKLTANTFRVTNEYVRYILKNGTSSLKSEDILKFYKEKYNQLSKIIHY